MGTPDHLLAFDPLEPDEVVPHLEHLVERGAGWVNLEPELPREVPETAIPQTSILGRIFGNQGPPVTLATWTPPATTRTGDAGPQTIGVQHATGGRLRPRLAEVGLEVPAGWVVRDDHPKRGLVVEAPAGEPVEVVLDWLLAAGEAASTVPSTGRWLAGVYER